MCRCEQCGEWFRDTEIITHLVTEHGEVELIAPAEDGE